MSWELGAAVARARGLATHRLTRERLAELAGSPTPGTLAVALEAAGYPLAGTGERSERSLSAAIDEALRRGAAARLGLLVRWLGAARALLPALFDDEDRRSLRALLRGTAAGLPARTRLAATLATPELPERLLQRLARSEDLAELVSVLERAGHPAGAPLAGALRRAGPDLLELELAQGVALAARAVRVARRAPVQLRDWVREGLDLENAWSALLATDTRAERSFLDGGACLGRAAYRLIVAEPSLDARRQALARAFQGRPLAALFTDPEQSASSLEARALELRLSTQRRVARLRPLGAAPILLYLLCLRAEVANLRRIHWGLQQGLARDVIVRELLEAA